GVGCSANYLESNRETATRSYSLHPKPYALSSSLITASSVPGCNANSETIGSKLHPIPKTLHPSLRHYFASGGAALAFPFRNRSNQYSCQFRLSTRCLGSPVRVRLWFSRGKKTISVVTPKCLSARNHCSPCSIGTRKSLSECRIRVGVFTLLAYFKGERSQYKSIF